MPLHALYVMLFGVARVLSSQSRPAARPRARGVLVSRSGFSVEAAVGHCINNTCMSLYRKIYLPTMLSFGIQLDGFFL
ncbi:hypothetical protein BD309DRAFT_956023 [Dichomitus squalens]|nr:hypothetical protein BD309DRAFT_956023 [Dichomitus squalens]